jgi:hypothetical protein
MKQQPVDEHRLSAQDQGQKAFLIEGQLGDCVQLREEPQAQQVCLIDDQ